MASPDFQLEDLSVEIEFEPHFLYPSSQRSLALEVSHPAHGKIASLSALYIDRKESRYGGRFLQIMDEDQQELADFSQVLFDKFGFLKKHLIENSYLRGTGVWGREINFGGLMYIFAISVDEKFRGHGIGSWTLEKLLESAHVKDDDFLICWPAPLNSDLDVEGQSRSELWGKIQKSLLSFFRKNHFRRIGRTQFFALSPNPDHPSRFIPVDADAPGLGDTWSGASRLVTSLEESENLPPWEAQRKDVEQRHARFPLHSAIYDLRGEIVSQKIQTAYDADPNSIHQQDDHGFTPAFTAASTKNVHALRKLIELGVFQDLTSRDNADGLMPLEACTQRMVSSREFSETMLQRWDGYSEEELLCVAAIKRVISPFRMTVTDEEYAERRKWGCTCGMCLDGWLSPRMKLRLEYEGEMKFDILETMTDALGFVNREPLAPDRFFWAPCIDFIPFHLRDQVYKSFFEGFQYAFEAVTFVSRQNVIPYPAAVRQTMLSGGFRGYHYLSSRSISFYFSKGGLPDFALDCILDAMEEQSPLGDGEFDFTFGEDLQKLPECANDLEFNLVRQNLALDPQARGPFIARDSEDMQESGSEEEASSDVDD